MNGTIYFLERDILTTIAVTITPMTKASASQRRAMEMPAVLDLYGLPTGDVGDGAKGCAWNRPISQQIESRCEYGEEDEYGNPQDNFDQGNRKGEKQPWLRTSKWGPARGRGAGNVHTRCRQSGHWQSRAQVALQVLQRANHQPLHAQIHVKCQ